MHDGIPADAEMVKLAEDAVFGFTHCGLSAPEQAGRGCSGITAVPSSQDLPAADVIT
jgi:hypothetical protein